MPFFAGLILLLFSSMAVAAEHDTTHPTVPSQFPSLVTAIRIKGPVTFCGEKVPLHLSRVREGLEKELLLMLWDRAQVVLWLKRSGRYFPNIQSVLEGAGLPDDLKYIAVIESALRPTAGSSKGARGVWQFIPGTGRKYGLTVNRYIDERRNFHLATRAAARYFRELHDRFHSWALACAGYNMGEQGLERRIAHQEVKNYYFLDLPTETERYVLRAVAVKLILSDPARYGFHLLPSDYYAPESFDRVRLRHKFTAPIIVVAKAANTYYKTIKEMNPQLLNDVIPGGEHTLFLPQGASEGFAERYQPLIRDYRRKTKYKGKTYTVRRGDTLTGIAARHNMPLWQLLKLNNLRRSSTIRPGQKLVIMK